MVLLDFFTAQYKAILVPVFVVVFNTMNGKPEFYSHVVDFINNIEPNLAQEVEEILSASAWFYRNSKTGEMKEKSSQKKFEQKWCHIARQPLSQYRHPTCMTEQRDINHLTAVVVSQSCSEASARDTHPL